MTCDLFASNKRCKEARCEKIKIRRRENKIDSMRFCLDILTARQSKAKRSFLETRKTSCNESFLRSTCKIHTYTYTRKLFVNAPDSHNLWPWAFITDDTRFSMGLIRFRGNWMRERTGITFLPRSRLCETLDCTKPEGANPRVSYK